MKSGPVARLSEVGRACFQAPSWRRGSAARAAAAGVLVALMLALFAVPARADSVLRAGATYQNPIAGPTADPQALRGPGRRNEYFLYSTGDRFPIERSTDLIHWTPAGTALRSRPSWVAKRDDWHPWAPSVIAATGRCPTKPLTPYAIVPLPSRPCYYLYYTAISAQFDENCVGVATATSPRGPFVDQGPLSNGTPDARGRPIGCGDNSGFGNIDPAPFIDSGGQEYLYLSTDFGCPPLSASCAPANAILQPTISALVIAPNHVTVVGQRVVLFAGTQPWETSGNHKTVEGPWMDQHNGVYHLFFSGGNWNRAYGEGDATLTTPLGPAVQDPANPILTDTRQVRSPGGGSTITGPHGGDWMLYHARLRSFKAPRRLFIDPIDWNGDGSVAIDGPTVTPQSPVP
jgi:arabinan endo-1,5-alpha-L-arabinosidase